MVTSLAPAPPVPANRVAPVPIARFGAPAREHDPPPPSTRRTIAGFVEDAALLLFAVFMVPVIILVIAAPMVLFVRVLLEIARRL
ncbi:MAG TPA: hypothetical protein VH138_08600 [Vicinamibacterales bacterium]|jgi:hypothetical protein|nr:hypothetical protein [Vicinamibacterales bacterium]